MFVSMTFAGKTSSINSKSKRFFFQFQVWCRQDFQKKLSCSCVFYSNWNRLIIDLFAEFVFGKRILLSVHCKSVCQNYRSKFCIQMMIGLDTYVLYLLLFCHQVRYGYEEILFKFKSCKGFRLLPIPLYL